LEIIFRHDIIIKIRLSHHAIGAYVTRNWIDRDGFYRRITLG